MTGVGAGGVGGQFGGDAIGVGLDWRVGGGATLVPGQALCSATSDAGGAAVALVIKRLGVADAGTCTGRVLGVNSASTSDSSILSFATPAFSNRPTSASTVGDSFSSTKNEPVASSMHSSR
jgi:hypothetical protein